MRMKKAGAILYGICVTGFALCCECESQREDYWISILIL